MSFTLHWTIDCITFSSMKRCYPIFLIILLIAPTILPQDAFYSIYSYEYFIPQVRINDRAFSLQRSALPRMYKNRSLTQDIRWVKNNDSTLIAFWESKGDTALHILTEISGIEWVESDFNINLLRYYTSYGCSNPIILPLGGIDNGSFIEAAPEGNRLKLNLIYQLAHRILDQAELLNDSTGFSIVIILRSGPASWLRLA